MDNIHHRFAPITILLIGSGNLSQHLKYWYALNGAPSSTLVMWNRNQDENILNEYILSATHVWLAISDASIVSFYEQHLINYSGCTVHFSGAVQDNRMVCAHPLMSFSNRIYADDFYSNIYFALTGCETLTVALPSFTNPFFKLDGELKPLYHALCVLAGNFPQLLWREVYRLTKSYDIPQEAFDVYIKKITENFVCMKENAITGPIARKDRCTINKNLEALSGTSLQAIYQSFLGEFLR